MDSILVDGHNYDKLTEIYHSRSEQDWVHNEFRHIYMYDKEHGELPHSLFVDYLKESYNLHPKRFSYWHPWISAKFANEPDRNCPTYTCSPQNNCFPHSVPEPPSAWLAFIPILYFMVWKLLKGKK